VGFRGPQAVAKTSFFEQSAAGDGDFLSKPMLWLSRANYWIRYLRTIFRHLFDLTQLMAELDRAMHLVVGPGGASTRTTSYVAPQWGQLNCVDKVGIRRTFVWLARRELPDKRARHDLGHSSV
jgi:hypothetical protein